ncbi:hypothetical protein YPPY66_0712 [Yersinia pestis PY-66]|nr:hypothetical protein YPPY66_0712 [Yersinia pestis PY-66]
MAFLRNSLTRRKLTGDLMKKHPIKADNKSILGRLSPIIFFNFFLRLFTENSYSHSKLLTCQEGL